MAEAGEIRLAVSDDILREVNRVLLRPKFGWSQDGVDAAIRQIGGFAESRFSRNGGANARAATGVVVLVKPL